MLIENNRPGVMARLGLGWDWFGARKPALIYCSISAFGQSGPRSTEGGFDLTIQAASGVMSVTGEPEGEPVKCGVPLSDFASGLYAAFTIAAKIAQVRAGGPGGTIDVPMFATTLAIAALQTSEYFGTGRNPRKLGSAHPRNAPYQAFRAGDGFFAIAAGNQKLWQSVCEVVGLPELLQDARFATPTTRAQNQVALKALLEARFQSEGAAAWLGALSRGGRSGRADQRVCRSARGSAVAAPGPGAARGTSRRAPDPHGRLPRTPRRRRGAREGHLSRAGRAHLGPARCSGEQGMKRFDDFVAAMTRVVEEERDEPAILARARPLLAGLIANDDWLPEEFAQPGPDTYRQYLLHRDPQERFSVISFVWGPGQKTPIHDHTVWGLVGVMRGAERCCEFERNADGRASCRSGCEHILRAGAVEAVSPTVGDIHTVANALADRPR